MEVVGSIYTEVSERFQKGFRKALLVEVYHGVSRLKKMI